MLSHRYLGGRSFSPRQPETYVTNPSGAPRAAHSRLRSCAPAGASPARPWRSPPTPDLLRRAGPVDGGAVGGRVQLDGRRLLLRHFGPREGSSNS